MMEKLKDRVLRELVSALLKSDLTSQELRKVSGDFKMGSLGSDLGRILDSTIETLDGGPYSKRPSSYPAQSSAAFELVQRRKLTKEQVLRIIRLIFGPKADAINPRVQMRQIVSMFFEMASQSQRENFIDMVDSPQPDPYLKGITNR